MTLQTLHPTSFDDGLVLDQTPWPGIDVPEDCDFDQLLKVMQPLGAGMLVNAIQQRLFLTPRKDTSYAESLNHGSGRYKHAPKLGTAHRLLHFDTMDSAHILRMSRVFESTWAFAAVLTSDMKFERHRVILPGPLNIILPRLGDAEGAGIVPEVPPGLPYLPHDVASKNGKLSSGALLINTIDGRTMSVASLKVEGGVQMPAYRAALKHKLIGPRREMNRKSVITFHEALGAQP